jgi:hypothetical protein
VVLRALTIGALLTLTGCDRCTSEDLPVPPPPKELSDLDMVEAPAADPVRAMWERATGDLDVAPGKAQPLRYVTPPCVLRYEARNEIFSEVADNRQPTGVVTVAEIVAKPHGDDAWTLEVVNAVGSVHTDGEAAPQVVDTAVWPPPTLRTEKRNLREWKGPTTLWAAHSLLPAMATLFFPLPARSDLGASVTWKQRVFERAETAKAERGRLAGKPVSPKSPAETIAHLAITRWLAIGGEPVARLEGKWDYNFAEVEPITSRRVERWQADAAFVARGWPLYYYAFANVWRFVAPAEDEGHHTMGTMVRALRLVEACEGPVLPRFARPEVAVPDAGTVAP